MKLRLSCCGEGLRASDNPKGIHVIATQIHPEVGVKPTVLGQTESIVSTTNVVDWTRSFVLDYEFGQELNIILSLRSGSRAISSALFDVSQVLGNGGILGKELKDKNGILIVRIEECKCVGQLQLQIRGLQLKNLDGIGFGMNKSDPFFEIQRQRVLARNNTVVWDAVYRSMVIDNDLNPIFSEFFIDLDELVGSSSESDLAAKKFRVIMFDYDKKGNQEIGSCLLSVNDLIDSVNDTALSSNASLIDSNKYFSLTLGPSQEVTGKIVVVKAKLIGVDVTEESTVNTFEKAPIVESSIQDVVNVPTVYATDELTFEPSDAMSSTFCNYIKGGCQLRVMCAIDATADNGDPRQESSLHYFNDNGLNLYEESIKAIFSVFWLYDSDQKYPVYGFGAKRDGVVSQCFPFGSSLEVDGVDGILKVYRETFRSGISMSSPRDFSEVIQTAGKSAQQELQSGQSYSILLIFTSGTPADSDAMLKAIQDVNDAPLSIVFIGIGKGTDLAELAAIVQPQKGVACRDNIRYVPCEVGGDRQHLAKLALQDIPRQLEEYFLSKNIHPDPTHAKDEIDVLPYSPVTDIEVPMEINAATGEISLTDDVKPPTHDFTTKVTLAELKRLGQKINANPTFGRIKRNINAKAVRQARYKINRLVGQNIL